MDEKLIQKFWLYVDKSKGENECWEWKGCIMQSGGYGKLSFRSMPYRAHRLSWEIANGPIPDGLHILHKCDNPPCVNPNHLFVGTNYDNILDRVRKGRSNQPRGEKHFRAQITQQQAIEIKRRYKTGTISKTELAQEYGVQRTLIVDLTLGRSWKHLKDDE